MSQLEGEIKPLLTVDRVSKAFAEGPTPVRALNSISFDVAGGEFLSLLGPSGSGKSTLLRIVGGLILPDVGEVTLEGRHVKEPQPDIGFIFQTTNLMPWRTVIENVLLPVEVKAGGVAASDRQRADRLLHVVGLAGFEDVYPKHLSGGMAQRVVLARTLMEQPTLLLMDEPFGALDALTRERMNMELMQIHRLQAQTVLMVTHSIAEAVFLADRVLIMSRRPGRIVAQVIVDLPRPRDLKVMGTARFGELTQQVRESIGSASGESEQQSPHIGAVGVQAINDLTSRGHGDLVE
jgi:NitT/TauT family transport system ATP-binding protein